jgi:predicted nucleic acid-binding protein
VIRSWLVERKFKLGVSAGIKEEYLHIFEDVLGFEDNKLADWKKRFGDRRLVKTIGAGTSTLSRDPKDNVFIATATAAKAKYLIRNDHDLFRHPGFRENKSPV